MIELLLNLMDVVDSDDENIQILRGKYHLKTNFKDAWKQHKEFRI